MGTTRVQWNEAIVKNPELMELLDGVHFHTLCEQDSDDLETTLASVKKQFGDLIAKVNGSILAVVIILQDQDMILSDWSNAFEWHRKNGRLRFIWSREKPGH